MSKMARVLYLIVGAVFPVFIGLLHTITHFADLVKPEIREYLRKEVVILGQEQALWNTWGIVSFMMGASFMVIGLLNIALLRSIPKNSTLPIVAILAMVIYQLCVIYVGYEYDQVFQFYGGIFGLTLISICLALALKMSSQE